MPSSSPIVPPNIHFWCGVGISQNYLNLLLVAEWQAGEFAYTLDVQNDLPPLIAALETAYPGLQISNRSKLHATLAPDTAPRLLLTPHDAASGGNYAAAFFADLKICINDAQMIAVGAPAVTTTVIEMRFGARMPAEVAFGKVSSSTNQLDITQERSDRPFEIYYDLTNVVLDPSVQGVATLGSSVAAITDPLPASIQGTLTTLVGKMLSGKSAAVIPSVAGDPVNLQRFPFGTGSWFVCQVLPARGNLYLQIGLASATPGIWSILTQLENSTFTCAAAQIFVNVLLALNPAYRF